MTKAIHIYCNGFEKTARDTAEAQTFIDGLRTRGCVGKEVVVTLGVIDPAFPKAAVFEGNAPSRREVLKAA